MSAIFDWARVENLQPEPITLEIWKKLPEDFCRLVEVVNGEAIRAESPTREHQNAARRLASMLESAADSHVSQHKDACLDVCTDFDVLLWDVPRTTIRRPDAALFECAPSDERPLRVHRVKLVIEVVSPGSEKVDLSDKKAEYAAAGIPWYWLVWVSDNAVASIEIHVLDHALGAYRRYQVLEQDDAGTTIDVPVRIRIEWDRLRGLSR
ncbi:Uma2 family endonuclease [Spirillospora sp. NPDC048911]|uniref:Uma2 family endonuclease n=1 Tax=Spirillospora sp. NPDC048911 TaxID=3364527 RepID=UPI0037183836